MKTLMPAERVRLVLRLLDNGPMDRVVYFGQDPAYDRYVFLGVSKNRAFGLTITGQVLFGPEDELEAELVEWSKTTRASLPVRGTLKTI